MLQESYIAQQATVQTDLAELCGPGNEARLKDYNQRLR